MITINNIMFRIYRNPLLQNVRKIDIIEDTKDVLKFLSVPALLEEKRLVLTVTDYRVKIPNDIYKVKSVMAMNLNGQPTRLRPSTDDRVEHQREYRDQFTSTVTYKVVPGWIYTDFISGDIEIIYTGFSVDEVGFPLIPDNVSLLKAIENYIKVQYFTVLAETGHLDPSILDRAEQQYTWYIGQASNFFDTPTEEETESLFNALIRLIPDREAFATNFKFNSNAEKLITHD